MTADIDCQNRDAIWGKMSCGCESRAVASENHCQIDRLLHGGKKDWIGIIFGSTRSD